MWRDGVDNSHRKPLSAQQHRAVCPPAQTPHVSTVYPNGTLVIAVQRLDLINLYFCLSSCRSRCKIWIVLFGYFWSGRSDFPSTKQGLITARRSAPLADEEQRERGNSKWDGQWGYMGNLELFFCLKDFSVELDVCFDQLQTHAFHSGKPLWLVCVSLSVPRE